MILFLRSQTQKSNKILNFYFILFLYKKVYSETQSEQELIRRWDSKRELLRSAPRKLPEFAEITQNNGHYAVQGHSRSPILVPIESLYTISY